EICPRYAGFWVNTQWPVAVDPCPRLYAELHDLALTAFEEGLRACRPGLTVGQLAEAINAPIAAAGCTSQYALAQGTGHAPFDPPIVRRGRSSPEEMATVIEEGMILAIQPHATRDGVHGVRLGDACVVGASGAERLSQLSLRPWGS
ncbi:MAG: M24 family metallopeptidase, partial [Chloroflexi bacterium]|nr:M24 family metallopeptidase [Chloroflexota bacterium]